MKFSLLFAVFLVVHGIDTNAGEFVINNDDVNEYIQWESKKHGSLQLRNLRARVIANDVHKQATNRVLDYLNRFQSAMPKASFPPLKCDSAQTRIYNHQKPTKRLTLLVSADAYRDNEFIAKMMVYAEDFKIGDSIRTNHKIRIQLGRLEREKFRFEMSALVDKDDGEGYVPIEVNTERYVLLD